MTPEELKDHIWHLADSRCNTKHPDYYDSLICVGPGSAHGFSPPCDECCAEVEREYWDKYAKTHGRELSPEEIVEMRKKLGLSPT